MSDTPRVDAVENETWSGEVDAWNLARILERECAELRALAIGGSGTTHFYYKDQCEALQKERDVARVSRDAARAALREACEFVHVECCPCDENDALLSRWRKAAGLE